MRCRSEYGEESAYDVVLTKTRDASCEFTMGLVDKLDRLAEAADPTVVGSPRALGSPRVLAVEAPTEIPLGDHVVLVHSASGSHLKAMDDLALALYHEEATATYEGRYRVQQHGHWERLADIPLQAMGKYHISESLQLSRIPPQAVKDAIAVQRYQALLLNSVSRLQLYGRDDAHLEKVLPLYRFLVERTVCYSFWVQAKPEPEAKKHHAPSDSVKQEMIEGADKDKSAMIDKDGATVVEVEEDGEDEEGEEVSALQKQAEHGRGVLDYLVGLIMGRKKPVVAKQTDAGRPSEQTLSTIYFRQCLIANSAVLDLLLHVSNVVFLFVRSYPDRVINQKKELRAAQAALLLEPPPPVRRPAAETPAPKLKKGGVSFFDKAATPAAQSEAATVAKSSTPRVPMTEEELQHKENEIDERARYISAALQRCAGALLRALSYSVADNLPVRMKLLSSPDVITAWVSMNMYGWSPPIGTHYLFIIVHTTLVYIV